MFSSKDREVRPAPPSGGVEPEGEPVDDIIDGRVVVSQLLQNPDSDIRLRLLPSVSGIHIDDISRERGETSEDGASILIYSIRGHTLSASIPFHLQLNIDTTSMVVVESSCVVSRNLEGSYKEIQDLLQSLSLHNNTTLFLQGLAAYGDFIAERCRVFDSLKGKHPQHVVPSHNLLHLSTSSNPIKATLHMYPTFNSLSSSLLPKCQLLLLPSPQCK
jgi:hypothetical protein